MTLPAGTLGRATVRASAAQGALERLAASSVDPDEVLGEVGLDASDFSDPTNLIYLSSYCDFFELAASRTRRANFGLAFGTSFHPQQLGLLGYVAISAPTLGAALRQFATYLPTHQQATHLSVVLGPDKTAAIEYAILDGSIKHRQQDAELSIGMLLNMFRHSLGPTWRPSAIHLMHAKPAGRTQYEDYLSVTPRFEQTSNRLVFSRSDLESPMPRQDDVLMRLLAHELHKSLRLRDYSVDVLERARQAVESALGGGTVSLEDISARCGLAPWTLRRKLKQRGLTFQQLISDTRRAAALRHMSAAQMSITRIAQELGYSEVSAFTRAFHRWTGVSPSHFMASSGTVTCLDASKQPPR
jgi:AraC-like DNA-binding protein